MLHFLRLTIFSELLAVVCLLAALLGNLTGLFCALTETEREMISVERMDEYCRGGSSSSSSSSSDSILVEGMDEYNSNRDLSEPGDRLDMADDEVDRQRTR